MKYILFTIAASFCTAPFLFAGSGARPFGSGIMDDFIKPYDDTAVELPGETARKPSVSRSAQLVDDSTTDTWGMRDSDSSASEKKTSEPSGSSSSGASSGASSAGSSASSKTKSGGSSAGSGSSSKSFTADGAYIPYSERYPEPEKEKSDSDFDRSTFDPNFNPFRNDYKYKDTDYQPNRTRPEFQETRQKIKDILGDGVPRVMTDSKVEELIHNPARQATLEAPTTPDRWTHAPNGWFCDFDDAMEKAKLNDKTVAVFFHSSDNSNSRKFKTDRMENAKFKNKMRDRLLIVYLDYPDNVETGRDKRNKDQVQHNRRIADQFHVSTYPTLIFLDSSGSEIGRITESKSTVSAFVDNADRIVPQRDVKAKNPTGFKIGGSIGRGESGVRSNDD
jgi:hypothetical protein